MGEAGLDELERIFKEYTNFRGETVGLGVAGTPTPAPPPIASLASLSPPRPLDAANDGSMPSVMTKDAPTKNKGKRTGVVRTQCTSPSRKGVPRTPAQAFEGNKDILAARLRAEGADSAAVDIICEIIFRDEITIEALTAAGAVEYYNGGWREEAPMSTVPRGAPLPISDASLRTTPSKEGPLWFCD